MTKIIRCSRCDRRGHHAARGLCTTCYSVDWRTAHGHPPHPRKPRVRACAGCNDVSFINALDLCRRCYSTKRRKGNPEVSRAYCRKWNARNKKYNRMRNARPDRRELRAQYERSHRPERNGQKRSRYVADRKRQIARVRQWQKTHPEQVRALCRERYKRRRFVMLGLPTTLTRSEWEKLKIAYGHRCRYCGRKPKRLDQDHVIPVTKGGGHTAQNIVPACRSCNSSKGNRHSWPPILLAQKPA